MRKNKGFTLIELMIVIAIIAIIAAIAIPNLMQSRLRANEATAVTCIRNYGTAQVTWQLGQQGTVLTNNAGGPTGIAGMRGYADNFRNLFYGNPRTTPTAGGAYAADTGRTLSLISQAMADAFCRTVPGSGCTDTVGTPVTPTVADGSLGIVYQGYYFIEDDSLLTATQGFGSNYALVGIPANSSTTGNNAFWMDSENSVLKMGLAGGMDQAGVLGVVDTHTPLKDATERAAWQAL